MCQFTTLGPLWSALAVNRSIERTRVICPSCDGAPPIDMYGTQQLQSMLETNATMTKLSFLGGCPPFSNSFFVALGAGLAPNTTLKILDLSEVSWNESDYLASLFEGGLDRNIGLEKLCLEVDELSEVQDFVSGIDRMAKTTSTEHHMDGSHRVLNLKKLDLCIGYHNDVVECTTLVLDCLIRNKAYFTLEELHLDYWSRNPEEEDSSLFVKLAAFIEAFPTVTSLTMPFPSKAIHDDSNLAVLANTLENNTTMVQFEMGGLDKTAGVEERNEWDPLVKPNYRRILCSVLQNKRELPKFLESSKKSLLPSALATLLKPSKYEAEQAFNLNHALYLVRNSPELFSNDGRSGGDGSEKVESVAN